MAREASQVQMVMELHLQVFYMQLQMTMYSLLVEVVLGRELCLLLERENGCGLKLLLLMIMGIQMNQFLSLILVQMDRMVSV